MAWIASKSATIEGKAQPIATQEAAPADLIAPIELLPKWLLCVPIALHVIWLGIRYRSITLPSVLNPCIETGGLVGESKVSYLRPIGERFQQFVATTALVRPGEDPHAARERAGLEFPLIAKPDIGWCGYGVRRIEDRAELAAYAAAFPAGANFLLQRLAVEPNEAGLLYVRKPCERTGRVTAATIRHKPHVIGDGQSTIDHLLGLNARTRRKLASYRQQLDRAFLDRAPRAGERVELTTVASVRVGGRYEDATRLVTPALDQIVDGIAHSIGDFHYGRFDVRFGSIEELRQGRFTIIEVNGAGSEAIQFWDPSLSLRAAFAGVFAKQRELYALADQVRRQGARPMSWRALLRAHFAQQRLIRAYPPSN